MKIGLICRGRTASTAIIDSLSTQYGLTNHSEKYFSVLDIAVNSNNLRNRFANNKHNNFETFKNHMLNYTKQLFSADNFICKLWPSMLLYRDVYDKEVTLDYAKNYVLFNITECWNLKEYDQLYFLDRDIQSSTYSWVYSKHINFFNIKRNQVLNDIYKPIVLTENDIHVAKFYILEYCLQQKIKQSLIKQNLKIIDVTDPSELINQNSTDIIPTNQKYIELIENYQIVDNLFLEYLPYCQQTIDSWVFY